MPADPFKYAATLMSMAQGSAAALMAMGEAAKVAADDEQFGRWLVKLAVTGLRGPEIWTLYKDGARQDAAVFYAAVWSNDEATLNAARERGS